MGDPIFKTIRLPLWGRLTTGRKTEQVRDVEAERRRDNHMAWRAAAPIRTATPSDQGGPLFDVPWPDGVPANAASTAGIFSGGGGDFDGGGASGSWSSPDSSSGDGS